MGVIEVVSDAPEEAASLNCVYQTVVERSHGHLYNSIANGIRNMPAYGHLIAPEDRWAIVAYMRALQRARNATLDDVPEEHRRTLR